MTTPARQSASVRRAKAPNTGCLRIFFSVFAVIGFLIIYGTTIRSMFQWVEMRKWEPTPCVIDMSGVGYHNSSSTSHSTTYSVEAIFHYTYQGRAYKSSTYHLGTGSTNGRAAKQRIVDQIPAGTHTTCFVDPANPAVAVIDRGLSPVVYFGFMGLIFLGIGAAGFYFAPVMGGTASQHHTVPQPVAGTGDPVALKPQLSPVGRFFLILGFALFWDGIMGFFTYMAFFSGPHSGVPIFAKIFIGFFDLIGIIILLAAFGGFAALFNPRLHLTSRTTFVPLGGIFQFQWTISGKAERLQKLRIFVVGCEESIYESGDSTSTARQVFAEIPVIETTERELIAQGQGRVTIPANLMHTFKGQNNKIIWALRVHGEIPHWPGIDEDFPLLVVPQSSNSS